MEREELLVKLVEEKLGLSEGMVFVSTVYKKNQQLTGMQFKNKKVSPVIYLDNFYKLMDDGTPIEEVVEKICKIYSNASISDTSQHELLENILDFSRIKTEIYPVIISSKGNEEYLKEKIHEQFLNLEILYKIVLNDNNYTQVSIAITEQLIDAWKISSQELHDIAFSNFLKDGNVVVKNIADEVNLPLPDSVCPMYFISNRRRMNGASAMLFKEVLRPIADKYNDDLVIIPSSVHEILVLPRKIISSDEITQMIKTVNITTVGVEDKLSDSAYLFTRADEKVSIY